MIEHVCDVYVPKAKYRFEGTKLLLSYSSINFDCSKHETWFKEDTKAYKPEVWYARDINTEIHVLVLFGKRPSITKRTRFCYAGNLPKIRQLNDEQYQHYTGEIERLNTVNGKPLRDDTVSSGQTSISLCSAQEWQLKLREELFWSSNTDRILWYVLAQDGREEFCKFLDMWCPWKFLYMPAHNSLDSFEATKKEKHYWDGHCVMLSLEKTKINDHVIDQIVALRKNSSGLVVVLADCAPKLATEVVSYFEIKSVDQMDTKPPVEENTVQSKDSYILAADEIVEDITTVLPIPLGSTAIFHQGAPTKDYVTRAHIRKYRNKDLEKLLSVYQDEMDSCTYVLLRKLCDYLPSDKEKLEDWCMGSDISTKDMDRSLQFKVCVIGQIIEFLLTSTRYLTIWDVVSISPKYLTDEIAKLSTGGIIASSNLPIFCVKLPKASGYFPLTLQELNSVLLGCKHNSGEVRYVGYRLDPRGVPHGDISIDTPRGTNFTAFWNS